MTGHYKCASCNCYLDRGESDARELSGGVCVQGERLAQVKKLFGKMHLGKKERARVTTPAALP